jgi:hypothetical protein
MISARIHYVGANIFTNFGIATGHGVFPIARVFSVVVSCLHANILSQIILHFSICYDVIIQLYSLLPQPSFDIIALQRGNEALINFSYGDKAYSWRDRRMFVTLDDLCYPTAKNCKCN